MRPYLVVYQTFEGKLICRFVKNMMNDIGYVNSYGWTIISIQLYNPKKHKFEEIIPFFSIRQKNQIQEKNKLNFFTKMKAIIEIIFNS